MHVADPGFCTLYTVQLSDVGSSGKSWISSPGPGSYAGVRTLYYRRCRNKLVLKRASLRLMPWTLYIKRTMSTVQQGLYKCNSWKIFEGRVSRVWVCNIIVFIRSSSSTLCFGYLVVSAFIQAFILFIHKCVHSFMSAIFNLHSSLYPCWIHSEFIPSSLLNSSLHPGLPAFSRRSLDSAVSPSSPARWTFTVK